MENKIQTTLQNICQSIPGILGGTLIEINSGLSLGAYSAKTGLDFNTVAAYNAEIIKQKKKALKALNIEDTMQDVMFNLKNQVHYIKLIDDSLAFYVAVDSSQGNLGLIKVTLDKNQELLKSIIG